MKWYIDQWPLCPCHAMPADLNQVTVEISTDPPEMKNTSGLQAPTKDGTENVHKTFDLPASLLE